MDDAKHENAMQWHLRSVHAVVNVKFNEDWKTNMAPMKKKTKKENASHRCGGCGGYGDVVVVLNV